MVSYINTFANIFIHNPEIKLYLTMKFNKKFKSYAFKLSTSKKAKLACRIAAKKLIHKILSLCKLNAGMLIKYVRNLNSQNFNGRDDLGKACHSVASEPFYYDTAYNHIFTINTPIAIDENGKAHLSEVLCTSSDGKIKQWACSANCHKISDEDIEAIIVIKEIFEKPLIEVRNDLQYIIQHGSVV